MKNGSSVQRKIIGISFLNGAAGKTTEHVWTERFMPSDAILIKAEDGCTEQQLLNQVYSAVKDADMQPATGSTFIFTVFYDLLNSDSARIATMLNNLTLDFSNGTMTSVMAQIVQFGYIGIKVNGNKETLRENTQAVLNANDHPLCLITTMPLETDRCEEWKAAVVYLDILRRDPSAIAAPVGYRLGYLKYGEHDADKTDELKAEIEKLQALLGKGGAAEVTNHVCALLQQIEASVLSDPRFHTEAKYQPLHPTTRTAPPKIFGKEKWANAATSSRNAVMETGKMLKARIVDEFTVTESEAVVRMGKILEDSSAGCGFVSDKNALNIAMSIPLVRHIDPMPIIITDSNCGAIIDEYLDGWRDSGIYTAKSDLLNKLTAAIPGLQAKYKNMENDWQNQLNVLNQKLAQQTSDSEFMNSAVGDGSKLKWNFKVTSGESMADKYILCRNEEDRDMVDHAGTDAGIKTYFIDKENGSLINLDEYEIKALHAIYYMLHSKAESSECDPLLLQLIL